MVISFSISSGPKRYRPKPRMVEDVDNDELDQRFDGNGESSTHFRYKFERMDQNKDDPTMYSLSASAKASILFQSTLEQLQALGPTFTLNMYPTGFTLNKYIEEFEYDVPAQNLIAYDKDTKLVLEDIEYGRLPPAIVNDGMQWKYVNGTILCEVRDYRVFVNVPVVTQVPLKMGLENVIEDMKSVSHQFSYSDALKFEARVLTFLNPFLNLDPKPALNFRGNFRMIDLDLDEEVDREKKRQKMNELTFVDHLERFAVIESVTNRHLHRDLRFGQGAAGTSWTELPTSSKPPTFSADLVAYHLSRDQEVNSSVPFSNRFNGEASSSRPPAPIGRRPDVRFPENSYSQ